MQRRIAAIGFTPTTMTITYDPPSDPLVAWVTHASRSELLEAGYLIAKILDREALSELRDYTNRRIDETDHKAQKEAADAKL